MSKVFQVLAQMASDSSLQNNESIEALLVSTDINAEQSEAIIAKDIITLERQLDICPDVYCMLFPAEDDEAEANDDKDEDKDDIKIKANG